jgi:dTDP-4-dehydrorhamnose 3,5-epimerase
MIEGAMFIPVKTFIDDRGYLTQVLQESDASFPPIKRLYVVGNFDKGVIRGFHKHLKEMKCFFVASGAAKFVLMDDREDSKTYQETDTHILSSRNPGILVVPTGVYNGWMSLEENTILVGMSNTNFDSTDDVRVEPFTFSDVWKVVPR